MTQPNNQELGALRSEITLTLHSQYALKLWNGRPILRDELTDNIVKPQIPSMPNCLSILSQIQKDASNDDPYADWYLIQFEEKVLSHTEEMKNLINKLIDIYQDQLPDVAKPMVGYLGLFKPAKSNLSNSRALKILNDVLDQYECSRLLAHCLSETVQAVRKKRLNGQNHEPLTNHNYLKSVYETQKISFVATPTSKPESRPEARMAEDKRRSDIEFIQRYVNVGQEDAVKDLPQYQTWLAWKKEQKNAG